MIDETKIVQQLIESKRRAYIVCTGAGAGLQKIVWETPGVSGLLAGASFTYSSEETADFIGYTTERMVNERVAMELAMAAYKRAWAPGQPAVGLAVTAVAASSEVHRGEHRVFVAAVTDDQTKVWKHLLVKGVGREKRAEDGRTTDLIGLQALAWACGIESQAQQGIPPGQLVGGDELAMNLLMDRPYTTSAGYRLPIEALTHGSNSSLGGTAIFPGAFNPPHYGHCEIEREMRDLGFKTVYNINTRSPNKPGLTVPDMLRRAKTLRGQNLLFTDDDPLYIDKARKWSSGEAASTPAIVVGADAVVRMLDPKWGAEISPMLEEMIRLKTEFIVFERRSGDTSTGEKQVVDALPESWRGRTGNLFKFLPGNWDVSSTEIREAAAR